MSKLSTIVAALALVAGCKKDPAVPTVPASSLPETEQEKEFARSPTSEPVSHDEPAAGVDPSEEPTGADDDEIPLPPSEIMAGGAGVKLTKDTVFVDPGAERPQAVGEVVAVMTPTAGSKVKGTIRFRQGDDGLELSADLTGLPKGNHAFHVHMFGDCSSSDGESAGPHFHFHGSSTAPEEAMITGNLGELVGSKAGKVKAATTIPHANLQGAFSIVGRSVIIHEKGNDPSQTPDGGAGKRLACGVIGIAQSVTRDKPEVSAPPTPQEPPTPEATETTEPPAEGTSTPAEKSPSAPPRAPNPTKPK